MTTPGTITKRLDTQHPSMLGEVVTDLKFLKGPKLRERIAQWEIYLVTLLTEGGISENEIEKGFFSPFAQIQFLEEHLKQHEIINVLIATDHESPFLDRYMVNIFDVDFYDPYFGEISLSGIYLDLKEAYSTPFQRSQALLGTLGILIEKYEAMEIELSKSLCKSDERYELQYQIAWGLEMFADTIKETKQQDRYKKATDTYLSSYEKRKLSGYVLGMDDLDLLMYAARACRSFGDLEAARGAYLSVINQSQWHLEQLETTDIMDDTNDPVWIGRRVLRVKQLHDDATSYLVSSALFHIQLLLEDMQQNKIENEQEVIRAIRDELDDAYERLQEKGWITYGKPSAYEAANLWRFTYGWYMMLVDYNDGKQFALSELKVLDKHATPNAIYDAAQIIIDGREVTFIDTPKKKNTCRIVPMNK